MTVWTRRACCMLGLAALWSIAAGAAPPTDSMRAIGARATEQAKQPPPSARKKVKVVFVVRSGGDPGGPVQQARVNAYDASFWSSRLVPIRQAETNPEGVATFDLDLTARMTLDVEITHQNFRAYRLSFPVAPNETEVRHDISLTPGTLNDPLAGAPANVTVCAADDTRAPVSGATITIDGRLPSHSRSAVTGADGCAVVPTIFLGTFRHAVQAHRVGFEDASSILELGPATRNRPPRIALTMKKQLGRLVAELAITVTEPTGAPVPDARVTISGTRSPLSLTYEKSTDVEGRARIVLHEFGNFSVRVSRMGYDQLSTNLTVPQGTERMPLSFQLVAKPVPRSNPVTVTVLSADRRRPVSGALVETMTTAGRTDAQGRVTLMMSLAAGDDVPVDVSAQGYRSARQVLDTRTGRTATDVQATGTVLLQPGEDPPSPNTPVRLVVQVRDIRNDRAIAGAEVLIRLAASPDGVSFGSTAANGDFAFESRLIRPQLGQGLALDIRKPGFLPRVNELVSADLLAPSNTPRLFTVTLEPAEIPLIVELKNSVTNERISGSSARFRFLHENRTVFTEENAYSGMLLIIREGPGVSIRRLRSTAMLLEVSHPKFKTKNIIVSADVLKVSLTVPTITVLVDRDWTRLDEELREIETRWSRFDGDLQKIATAQLNLAKYEEESLASKKKAQAILDEIAATTIPVDPNAVAACAQARDAAGVIERAGLDAKLLATNFSLSLALAEKAAATCASVSQADDVLRQHRNALEYAAQLALAEKVAVASNTELKALATVVGAAGGIRAVDALVTRFFAEKEVLEELAGKAKKEYDSAFAIRQGVARTHAALSADFEALKAAWSIQLNADGNHQHAEVLSRDLSQRFDAMALRLRRASAPDLDGGTAERIEGRVNDLYRQYFNVSESAASKVAACPITPRDRDVEAISEILFNVTFALGASDLPARAETCRKADACDAINLEVTALLEKGDVRSAEAAVTRARGGKCNLKPAEDMIALVKANSQCRFQEASDAAARLPVSIRQQPFISNRSFDANRGLANEKEVEFRLSAARALMRQAELAQQASRCDDASRLWRDAEDQLANAEAYTSGIACLKPRIDVVRAELNSKKTPCGSMPRTPPPVPPTTPPPGPPTTPPTGPPTTPPSGPPTSPPAPPTSPTAPPTAPSSRPGPTRGAPPIDKVPEVLGPRAGGPPPAPPPPPRVLTASLDCGTSLELRPGRLSKNCDVIVQGWRTDTANPVRVEVRMAPPETGVEATPGNTQSDPGTMNSTSASDYANRYVFQQGFWASARASAGTRVDAEVIVSQAGGGRVVLPLRLNVIAATALDGSSERPVGDIRRGTGGSMCVFRYKSFGDKPECFSFVAASCANSRYADPQYERIAESMTSAQAGAVVDQYSRYFDDAYQCRVPSGTPPQYTPVPPATVQQGSGGNLCVWRYKLTGDAPMCFHVAIAQCGRYGPPYELIGQNMTRGEAGTRADQISRYFNDDLGCRAGSPPKRKDPPQGSTPPSEPPTPPSPPPPPPPPPDPPRPARTLSRFGISPRDVTVQPGQSVDLRASGVWSDAPSQVVDLTGQVRWSPSNRVTTTTADAGRRIVVTATHPMGTDSITITVATPAPPPDPNTGPPPPPDVAARMKAAAGAWYTGSKDQCWTTTISVSGDSLTGSWTLAGPFTDSASFKVTYKNGGFSGDYSGSYNNPGCVSCNKGTSGTRVGTITLSFTDTTLTTHTVENDKSSIWSAGRSFSGTATRTPCKAPAPEQETAAVRPLAIARSAPRRRLWRIARPARR